MALCTFLRGNGRCPACQKHGPYTSVNTYPKKILPIKIVSYNNEKDATENLLLTQVIS